MMQYPVAFLSIEGSVYIRQLFWHCYETYNHFNLLLASFGKWWKLALGSLLWLFPQIMQVYTGIFTTTASFLPKLQPVFTLQQLLESTWALGFHNNGISWPPMSKLAEFSILLVFNKPIDVKFILCYQQEERKANVCKYSSRRATPTFCIVCITPEF